MQSKTFEEFLERLKKSDYEIKHGKYLAVKLKYGKQFIRLKSLGENYSEQALKNRLAEKLKFQEQVKNKIVEIKMSPVQNLLQLAIFTGVQKYIIAFEKNAITMKPKNERQYFSFTNDKNLANLMALNKKINAGTFSLDILRKSCKKIS
ncbi:hypothetical protein FACS1894132_06960 [Clostridia bacterium]|nr:hypothetical protein FACS1894132_06960 [Clostridia bacterium]